MRDTTVLGLGRSVSGASIPKLLALNTALVTAIDGRPVAEIRADPDSWGRIVETAVGAHLVNSGLEVFYWRERNREVDWVVRGRRVATAIEVKSGARRTALPGMAAFAAAHGPVQQLLVGGDGMALDEFLRGSPPAMFG